VLDFDATRDGIGWLCDCVVFVPAEPVGADD
jgi:hypothetical protein